MTDGNSAYAGEFEGFSLRSKMKEGLEEGKWGFKLPI